MKSYIVCSGPRCGNHFLISLLRQNNLGVAERHFQRLTYHQEMFDRQKFIDYGLSSDGVIWGGLLERIRDEVDQSFGIIRDAINPEMSKIEAVNALLPNLKFIYLYRINMVRQGVSFMKLRQSNIHTKYNDDKDTFSYTYNADDIERYILNAAVCASEWQAFFEENRICPLYLSYEELVSNPIDTVEKIVEFLELPEREIVYDKSTLPQRLFNAHSQSWIDKYHSNFPVVFP